MNKIVEGLVSALLALPQEDKNEAVSLLLSDQEFKRAVSNLLVEKLFGSSGIIVDSSSRIERPVITRRESGSLGREAYLPKLKEKGVVINYTSKTWARTSSDLWIGMPFANEQLPNRWFLGTGEEDLMENTKSAKVAIILLCKPKEGELLDFIIPPFKVEEIIPNLAKSKGQFKFNVRKTGSRYFLALKGASPLDITDYLGQVSVLR